jgi:hypothetical protein
MNTQKKTHTATPTRKRTQEPADLPSGISLRSTCRVATPTAQVPAAMSRRVGDRENREQAKHKPKKRAIHWRPPLSAWHRHARIDS